MEGDICPPSSVSSSHQSQQVDNHSHMPHSKGGGAVSKHQLLAERGNQSCASPGVPQQGQGHHIGKLVHEGLYR